MIDHCVLLFTDVEGSTQLTEQLGDEAASVLWAEHDRLIRRLLRDWRGREIDKSDGFLLLFSNVDDAIRFAMEMHRVLGALEPPLPTRASVHRGRMIGRENNAHDIALGAKPLELDGIAKAVGSRIMMLARGGQTLLSADARVALSGDSWRVQSHGHWRLKGVAQPIEVFEVVDGDTPFEPPAESTKSYRVVAAGEGWKPVAELPHGLIAERDSFVGRKEALSALAALFDGDARLVSVLGMGGIGKTRLALRYARHWLGDYPGGAWFCDLSSARSLDGIVHAVAHGLDVTLGKADPVQQLGAAIAGRGQCLIILDNFEQVTQQAEATVGQWLQRAPEVRLLVTSREVLGIRGEETFVLAPLSTSEAVRLFARRARAADHNYLAADAEQAKLQTLVDLLDRLPLAIELAAARIRVMGPGAMIDRMGERFKLLASAGGRHDRQATLRATLDWSWELLSPTEQSALAQLSVFEGGFTLEAAEAVVILDPVTCDGWVVDVVQSLIQKSLVREEGEGRFGQLRSVHDYTAMKVSSGGGVEGTITSSLNEARRRHWQYFARLDEVRGPEASGQDLDNIEVACRRAAWIDWASAAGALSGMWSRLRLTGPFRSILTYVEMFDAAEALDDATSSTVNRVAAAALNLLGDRATALQRGQSSLEHAMRAKSVPAQIQALCQLADIELAGDRVDTARAHLGAADALIHQLYDPDSQMRVLQGRAALELREGRLEHAKRFYEHALELAHAAHDRRRVGGIRGNLGVVAQMQGELQLAHEHYVQALGLAGEVGDRQWEGNTRCNLGLLLHLIGSSEPAKMELKKALQVARSLGHRRLEAVTLCNLGIVAEACEDYGSAINWLEESLALAQAMGDRSFQVQASGYLGLACSSAGRSEHANAHFEKVLESLDSSPDATERATVACQYALACAVSGNPSGHQEWLQKAEQWSRSNPPNSDSELGHLLRRARERLFRPV